MCTKSFFPFFLFFFLIQTYQLSSQVLIQKFEFEEDRHVLSIPIKVHPFPDAMVEYIMDIVKSRISYYLLLVLVLLVLLSSFILFFVY